MPHRRRHIRVPVHGEVTLFSRGKIFLQTEASNISAGGICIAANSHILDQIDYQIRVITTPYNLIEFSGQPVHKSGKAIGMKITDIDTGNLESIRKLVEDFQSTDDFIRKIDEDNIIDDWIADDAGEELAITFEPIQTKGKT
jgi:hypothetical protein